MTSKLPNDNYSVFDEFLGQWVLTPEAVQKYASIDLAAEMRDEEYPEIATTNFLRKVSDVVYMYIHDFAFDNAHQDFILANFEEARKIVTRAMICVVQYARKVGLLVWSTDDKELAKIIPVDAKSILNRPLACYGFKPITYCGV